MSSSIQGSQHSSLEMLQDITTKAVKTLSLGSSRAPSPQLLHLLWNEARRSHPRPLSLSFPGWTLTGKGIRIPRSKGNSCTPILLCQTNPGAPGAGGEKPRTVKKQ